MVIIVSKLPTYQGKFVIMLEPDTDLSMLSMPSVNGSLEIEKKEAGIIVRVNHGLVEQYPTCVHFHATKRDDVWCDPFVWPNKNLIEIRTSRQNILWKKSFIKG